MKNGKARSATLWARPGENILTSQGPKAYSYQERLEVYRVWKLMRISEKDRPVFQTSITDNLVFVDQFGRKTQAAA